MSVIEFPLRYDPRLAHPSRARARLSDLEALAHRLGEDVLASGFHVPGPRSERRYVALPAGAGVDAWLIAWPKETSLELHDHGGACGALLVLRGEVVEAFTHLEGAASRPLRAQRLVAGESVAIETDRVHDVWNPSDDEAVTLHVYAPKLEQMTFYEWRAERYLEPLRTEPANP